MNMFSKFSRFRSKGNLNSFVPQRDENGNHDDNFSASHGKSPTPPSPQTPTTPPKFTHHPSSLPTGKHTHKPSLPLALPVYEDSDFDMDDNISFAEAMFPVTPLAGSQAGRRSSGSFLSDEEEFSPNAADSMIKSPVFDAKKLEGGLRRSDLASKKSWGSQDLDETSSKRSWDFKKETGSKKSYNMSSKRSWTIADKLAGPGTMKSWTSSSVQEEEIDIGPAVLPPYDDAEEDFLEEFEDYFENLSVDNVRREQYSKLEEQRLVYLDYASFALYSRYQVEEHMRILMEEGPCLGSASVTSSADNPLFRHVSDTTDRLLAMLNTNRREYSIIFTAGFQESFGVVAESYPFQRGSPLLVCRDNHAAVRPVIQSAYRAGGRPILAPVTDTDLCLHSHELRKLLQRQAGRNLSNGGLFVYPAQSNFSGIKHSLHWVAEAQQHGWHVCIDATTLLPTGSLDLTIHQPDFVVGSFHHMVGYPSGLGYLLVRSDSFWVQDSGQGTVKFVQSQDDSEREDCHIKCPADNTMNLLQFAALSLGLRQLEAIGLSAIQTRTGALVQWLVQRLRTLRHKDEEAPYLLRVYGSHVSKNRGNIVTFNVIDSTGMILPPDIVMKLAMRCNITLSVGNFNNPGLANLLGMVNERSCDVSIIEGNWGFQAVRASLGPVSNFSDAYRLVQFLSRFRDEDYLSTEAMGFIEERTQQ